MQQPAQCSESVMAARSLPECTKALRAKITAHHALGVPGRYCCG